MRKILLSLVFVLVLAVAFSHTGGVETTEGLEKYDSNLWGDIGEHHEAMHQAYGEEFYCNMDGCSAGNDFSGSGMMGPGMASSPYWFFYGSFGAVIQILAIVLLVLGSIYLYKTMSKKERN